MGYNHDEFPGHEGYPVGFVCSGALWRELGYPEDSRGPVYPAALSAACDCGWRSPRFCAPPGAVWHPYSVELPDRVDELVRLLWKRHLEDVRGLGAAATPYGEALVRAWIHR